MIRTAIAVAALVGMTASTATSAQTTADEAPTAHVRYTDLDLSQPDDMKLLHHRVAMAVNTVCPIPVAGSMDDIMANMRCRTRAIKGADQQIAALVARRTYAQADTKGLSIQP
ncbi:UrcA family protein [Sphingopyxis panaciterrulae]|jgi:UrcA family protein|uniref:UrcA family protein n=1 Tax=Sphingopyxis panaciterrulae TaxID=462372 RepID=A0A7W9B7F0_9SPHN|nr:UrcA family protein [Sphingopyxis panaciterrulae]MBB5707650.1 UrcA family protein [Sphingopyxis panaciterrulae]